MKIPLAVVYKAVKKWSKSTYFGDKDPELYEACDFGDSYGFLFRDENKYENVYWCVNKKTLKPFVFKPNQDAKKFQNRKRISIGGDLCEPD